MFELLVARGAGPSGLDASVVFWDHIVLICVVGVLFLLTLPRALARLSPGGQWEEGHFFRGAAHMSDDQSVSIGSRSTTRLGEKPDATKVPRHVRAWQAIVPVRLMNVLRFPLVGSVGVGGTIVCVLYFALLLFAVLYRTTILTNPVRVGPVRVRPHDE
ncbi:hypothetical protein C8Q80DRAFT_1354535 [Daedaleopsis nitida]|nr:hypothetical protein C8Q80DRAFT_1354535 [Daedaleopsis nitida]